MNIKHATIHIANLTFGPGHGLPDIAGELVAGESISSFVDDRYQALSARFDLAQDELAEARLRAMANGAGIPLIGQPWAGQGGIYVGMGLSEDGIRNEHTILSTVEPDSKLNFVDGGNWAKALRVDEHADFDMPTPAQSALLYANLRSLFDLTTWCWTNKQYSEIDAFIQGFSYGGQSTTSKKFEARVRAVRRFAA